MTYSIEELLALDKRHLWHPFTQHGTESAPLPIVGAKAATLTLGDGSELLDLVSSWWTCTHGHAHPELNKALAEQAEKYEHVMFAGFTHEPAVEVAARVCALMPGDLNKVFYSDDGSTAVEVALKMAYQHWVNRGEPRTAFLAFDGAYHGDTVGAMAVGRGSEFFTLFHDLLCEVKVVPYPYTWNNDPDVQAKEDAAVEALEKLIAEMPGKFAGMIIEPLIQGAGGMRVSRPEFLKRIVETAQAAGILVILDEVATGFGRTGTMFAHQQAGITPDMVCLSKCLTAGYLPMAATVVRDEVYDSFIGESFNKALAHGHSFTANPLACAVARRSLQLFEEEGTLARIGEIVAKHKAFLESIASRPDVEKTRQAGTIMAFDIVGTGSYQSTQSRSLRDWFLGNGLNIRPLGTTVYLMPPFCITDAELTRAYSGIIEGLDRLAANELSMDDRRP
ncbi:adenosylmethionine--8-amino-7-oxononanoate transaminase [Methyloligella sp. 2.7D]|uniref:adenosylmethionine--8-amino-7-oxononanoate transaminase n=1 Tax=unclassified Methyloligella TaxID=2625955 RepID=UPI00157C68C3|nr:adenosylmethionine--8-amino-7-oxononanoate transaminase [Methyloligella sp. GL2]QKP77906.1 adenosylmethionine--8-amino-7-oxononanoate transaminase [Methyloligella sp. GL2]